MDEITGHWNANFLSFPCHNRLPFGIWYFSGRCTECTHIHLTVCVYTFTCNEHDKISEANTCIDYNARKIRHQMSGAGTGEREHRTPSVRSPYRSPFPRVRSLSPSPTARSTNLFFSDPMFLFTTSLPSTIYTGWCCVYLYISYPSPFIPSVLPFTVWHPCITQSFAIRPLHSLSFFPKTSISKTFISLATLSFDWLGECSFVEFRGFLSIPKCR